MTRKLTQAEFAADKERLDAFIQSRAIAAGIAQQSIEQDEREAELEAARQRNHNDKLADRGLIGWN